MRDKKAISTIVSTILIIGIVLVVLGIIGAIVFGFVRQTTNQISSSKYSVRTGILSANVNFTSNIATMVVERELGMGNLVGLKFIFQDKRSSEVFDIRVVGFDELEQRTFDINLLSENSTLILYDLQSVSVAPIILLDSGEEVIGFPSEMVSGLNKALNRTDESFEEGEIEAIFCYSASDCGANYFVNGTETCLGSSVHKFKRVFTCILGFCGSDLVDVAVENCSYQCYDGACVEQLVGCTPETINIDCGSNGFVGVPTCSQDGTKVIQNYKTYSCVNETCGSSTSSQTIEECNETEVCFNAECFVPLECTTNADCDPGEICVEGICVLEEVLNAGAIASIWPFGIGEYFDSPNLLNPQNKSLVNSYIVFPGSAQTGCLKINEHLVPNATGASPYVRLNVSISNISSGNSFQVWETDYICSFY